MVLCYSFTYVKTTGERSYSCWNTGKKYHQFPITAAAAAVYVMKQDMRMESETCHHLHLLLHGSSSEASERERDLSLAHMRCTMRLMHISHVWAHAEFTRARVHRPHELCRSAMAMVVEHHALPSFLLCACVCMVWCSVRGSAYQHHSLFHFQSFIPACTASLLSLSLNILAALSLSLFTHYLIASQLVVVVFVVSWRQYPVFGNFFTTTTTTTAPPMPESGGGGWVCYQIKLKSTHNVNELNKLQWNGQGESEWKIQTPSKMTSILWQPK